MRIPDRAPDLAVVAVGTAKTKGSTKSFIPRRKDGSMVTRQNGAPMVVTTNDAGAPAKAWAGTVAASAAEVMIRCGMSTIEAHVPVVIEMIFYRPRPSGHFGTGRNAGVLKDSAPPFPSTKPDVDKLERAILDALKGVAWSDDGQVIGAPSWKLFGTPARCEMRLWRVTAADADEMIVHGPSVITDEMNGHLRRTMPQDALFGA